MGDINEDEPEKTIADDRVVTKYKMAGGMANSIMVDICRLCVIGASVKEICEKGDAMILEETNKVLKSEKNKGIGFPVCVSRNYHICHFSPSEQEDDQILEDGDVVKIDFGVHIDGFIAGLAHTLTVGENKENKIVGQKADVILAAYYAAEIAMRLFKPGNTNEDVTAKVSEIAKQFGCTPVEGMLSHQLQQNIIDGDKTIIQNPSEVQSKDHKKVDFELHEVYCLDVIISTGGGKTKDADIKTTVYKRTDNQYSLKMKASRQFYTEVANKFTMMPFTLRSLEDQKKARLGISECTKHELLIPYPVLIENSGEFVAQFKYTLLIMPSGIHKITQSPINLDQYHSEYSLTPEQKTVLAASLTTKPKKNKNKKAQAQKEISEQILVQEASPVGASAAATV